MDERRPAGTLRTLSGWGGTPRSAAWVVPPGGVAGVREALRCAPRGALGRGLGRSYGDAAQNAGGTVLDMTGLAGIHGLDLDAGTVTAEAGVSVDALIRALLPFGLFVPVTPGTRFVTLGGAIAADIHGKNHHRDGSFGAHVAAFDLLLPSGELRTVTADGDPEAFAATLGGMGLTGIVTAVTLRLLRVESGFMRVDTERAHDLDDALDRMTVSDEHYRYSVAWIDLLARGRALGRSVLLRANHATPGELPQRLRATPLAFRDGLPLRAPRWVPGGLLRKATVSLFNEAYFRRAPAEERGAIQSIARYFHPLDRVEGWNRAYGPRGFVQYQCVVPFGEEAALREIVRRLSDAGCPSFLAVLKRFGPGSGLLSFPAPGWTLALDLPAGLAGLGSLLDGLDRIVAAVGGRVYLAKDARLGPEALREMYPALQRWQEIRARLDPAGVMRSDLARRLKLI